MNNPIKKLAVVFACCFIVGFFAHRSYQSFMVAKNYDPQKDIQATHQEDIEKAKENVLAQVKKKNGLTAVLDDLQKQSQESLSSGYKPTALSHTIYITIDGVDDLFLLGKVTMGKEARLAIIKKSDYEAVGKVVAKDKSILITDATIKNIFTNELKDYTEEQKAYVISESIAPILFKLKYEQISTDLAQEDWIFLKKIYRGGSVKLWESKDVEKLSQFLNL